MLGFPNRADAAVLSGGSWQATLPLGNLQDRTLGLVARSANVLVGSTSFDLDLALPKDVRVLGLINHNLALQAQVRIRAAAVADFSVATYDSGWVDAWPVCYPDSALEWEMDNWWTGKYSDEQRAGYTAAFIHILPTTRNARYWRVEIRDTTNPAGTIDIGRLFIGPAWQPRVNFSFGEGIGWETTTQVQSALSGGEFFQSGSQAGPTAQQFRRTAGSGPPDRRALV